MHRVNISWWEQVDGMGYLYVPYIGCLIKEPESTTGKIIVKNQAGVKNQDSDGRVNRGTRQTREIKNKGVS